ncbi:60S ribosomal protein L43 [Hypoxylon texense]
MGSDRTLNEGVTSIVASSDSPDVLDTNYPPGEVAVETKTSPDLRPSREIKRRKWFGLREWLWEFGAAVLSVSCTIVVLVVLYAFQGRALSSWQFVFQVSLNSFVSILSGLSRASLLVSVASCISQLKWIHFVKSPASLYRMEAFDLASRGPWGALVLLWRMNFKTKLAAMASLVTILYTTPSGFAIELIQYETPRRGFNSSARAHTADDCRSIDGTIVTFATATAMFHLDQPEIMECKIEWSARRYENLSVKNGSISLGTFDELPLSCIGYIEFNDSSNGNIWPQRLSQFAATFDREDKKNKDRRLFTASSLDHGWIGGYLARIFSSSDRDDFGKVLSKSSSIEETVHNITESMTYAVSSSRNATEIAGDAIGSEQFISVSWRWMTLLVAEVLMGLALLALTVRLTEREEVAAWKSSSLVSFFIRTEGWEDDLPDTSAEGIENISRRMHGSMKFDRGALMFVKVDK